MRGKRTTSRILKISSHAVKKIITCCDKTGSPEECPIKEDQVSPLLQRRSSLALTVSEINNERQLTLKATTVLLRVRVQKTSQHQLFGEDEQMVFACVVSSMKHPGGGAMVWGCFGSDTVWRT